MPNARQLGCSESRNGSIQWPTTRKLTEANADQEWSDDESVANGEEDDADYIDDTRDARPSYIADDGQALAAAELEWAQLVQLGRERDFVVEDPQDDVILRRALRLLYAERFGQANVAENPSINIEYDQLTPEKAQTVVNNTKIERAAAMVLAAELGARPKAEPLPNEQTSSSNTRPKKSAKCSAIQSLPWSMKYSASAPLSSNNFGAYICLVRADRSNFARLSYRAPHD